MKTSKLILSSGLSLVAFAVAAFDHDHGRRQPSSRRSSRPPVIAAAPQPADEDLVPAYLLAAICGMPAKEGDAAFERRVQLARLLSDRAQIDDKPRSSPLSAISRIR